MSNPLDETRERIRKINERSGRPDGQETPSTPSRPNVEDEPPKPKHSDDDDVYLPPHELGSQE